MEQALTAQQLRAILDYDHQTGVFRWKHRHDAPACWNAKWAGRVAGRDNGRGYVGISINNRRHYAHRLAWLYVFGCFPPEGRVIDHADDNRSNNAIANLQLATVSQNGSRRPAPKHNTSGITGVSWNSRRLKWEAYITVNSSRIALGFFESKETAITKRRAAEEIYFGEFAYRPAA